MSFLCSCQASPGASLTLSGDAMTMPYRIVVGGAVSPEEEMRIKWIILNTFREIDQIYNRWNPESEIAQINRAPANKLCVLSKELAAFLARTDEWVKRTNGRFDPTIQPLQQLWKENLKHSNIPIDEDLKDVSQSIHWSRIHLENGQIWKEHEQTALDLGGVAKGYAVDLLIERINAAGYSSAYVEWGGEVRTSGKHSEGRAWRISVNGEELIEVEDLSLASSGDEFQRWEVDGTIYFHIFDPQTLRPLVVRAGTISKVTIATEECFVADVIATAAMLFSTKEEAEAWLESLKDRLPKLRYWIETTPS